MDTIKQYKDYVITGMVKSVEPVVVDKAKGSILYSKDGKEYLDCFSGISVVNSGHCHPKILSAAKKQMEELVHCNAYMYHVPVVGELAEKLAGITPGSLKKTFFGNSGAEAIEGALRLAKQATGRREIIALTHSFHGRTVGTLSITGNSGRKKGFGPYLSGVAFGPSPYCYRCPYKLTYPKCGVACAEALEDVVRFHTSGDVAAFIMEPIQGEGGIIVPPNEYFKIVSTIAKKIGALVLIDEVQTGFGRTGKMFAIEHYDIGPDMMMMAKGIANGFPLGAFISKEEYAGAFKPGDHLSTFGGNPISCAASLATIGVLKEEKLIENSNNRGEEIVGILKSMKQKLPLIGDIRGKGLMIGIELVKDNKKTPATEEAGEVKRICRENGVLLGVGGVSGNVIRIQPPLIITSKDCNRICEVLEKAFKNIANS